MNIPEEYKYFYDVIEKVEVFDEWKAIINLPITPENDSLWTENIITERKVFSFFINDGVLKTNYNFTDFKGKEIAPKHFSNSEFEYLKRRIDSTLNIHLKAKYCHLIWQEIKHNKYAEKAINSYIEIYNSQNIEDFHEFSKIVSSLLYISTNSKYKDVEIKAEMLSITSKLKDWQKHNFLNLFLKINCYKISELKNLIEDIPNWVNANYFFNKNSLLLGVDLFGKLKLKTDYLYELLAINEDLILDQHREDSDFIKLTSLGDKCIYLKNTTKKEEFQKCLEWYNQLKKTVKLHKISYNADPIINDLLNKYTDQKTEAIISLSTEQILTFFCLNEDILVDPAECKNQAIGLYNNSLSKMFSLTTFDININFKNLDENQKLEKQISELYILEWNIKFYVLFYKVFRKGIIEGKLTYQKTYDFLETYTWYNFKFERELRKNEIETETNWITLIAPGIHSFFTQFELSMLLSTNRANNYILALDSLTLKFEGALRDFIRLNRGSTTKINKGITQEQLLDDLIENPIIKELFSEKDIGLFKFAFTKNGKDIRNNIAHSFFSYSDYSLQNVALIFLCILRLGKYKF
jgi:hypothetical protein